MLNVFLSGKVDLKHGEWRDALLLAERGERGRRLWECVRRAPEDHDRFPQWPEEENRWVLGMHQYVGPYRLELSPALKGSWEGRFHGTTWWSDSGHGEPGAHHRLAVATQCKDAIRRADLVFAYINTLDCFGTLVEIGYARAHQRYVHLLIDANFGWENFWFAETFADSVAYRQDDESIGNCFKNALVQYTARPSRPNITALPTGLMDSFSNIARWTSDPRVRTEAQRMLKALGR